MKIQFKLDLVTIDQGFDDNGNEYRKGTRLSTGFVLDDPDNALAQAMSGAMGENGTMKQGARRRTLNQRPPSAKERGYGGDLAKTFDRIDDLLYG